MIYTDERCHLCNGNMVLDDDPIWKSMGPYPRKLCLQGGHDPLVHKENPALAKAREDSPGADYDPSREKPLPSWLYSRDQVLSAALAAQQQQSLLAMKENGRSPQPANPAAVPAEQPGPAPAPAPAPAYTAAPTAYAPAPAGYAPAPGRM